jgi:hypothetical protein
MARALTSGTLAEVSKSRVYPVVFVEIDFADGPQYVWSGIGTKSWNSQTWIGLGYLGKIDAIEEGADIEARGVTLTLNGIPQALLNEALAQTRQGQAVKIWAGFTDASGNVIVDPFQSFAGRLDVPTIDEGGETATISITAESRLIDLHRSRERRYTPDDQAIDYPTDQGFNYVPSLQESSVVWGKGTSLPVKTGGGSRGPGNSGGGHGRMLEID